MPTIIVDFTKLRKGSVVNGMKVDYCPVCGRKGLVTFEFDQTKFVHYAIMVQILGCQLAKAHDECRLNPKRGRH